MGAHFVNSLERGCLKIWKFQEQLKNNDLNCRLRMHNNRHLSQCFENMCSIFGFLLIPGSIQTRNSHNSISFRVWEPPIEFIIFCTLELISLQLVLRLKMAFSICNLKLWDQGLVVVEFFLHFFQVSIQLTKQSNIEYGFR